MCPNCYVHKPCADCARHAYIQGGTAWYWERRSLEEERLLAEYKARGLKMTYGSQPITVSYEDLYGPKKETPMKKHMVVNSHYQVQVAKDHCWPSKEEPHPNVGFDDAKTARDFATYLAGKRQDESFTVFTAVGTAATEKPPVKWTKAGNRA